MGHWGHSLSCQVTACRSRQGPIESTAQTQCDEPRVLLPCPTAGINTRLACPSPLTLTPPRSLFLGRILFGANLGGTSYLSLL